MANKSNMIHDWGKDFKKKNSVQIILALIYMLPVDGLAYGANKYFFPTGIYDNIVICGIFFANLLFVLIFPYVIKYRKDNKFFLTIGSLFIAGLIFLIVNSIFFFFPALSTFCCLTTYEPTPSSTEPPPPPTITDTPPPTITDTPPPTITDTPPPTITPILTLPVLINTPIPNIDSIISSEAADNILEIARYEWDESEYAEIKGHPFFDFGSFVAFSNINPNLLAAGSRNSTIRLYRLADGNYDEHDFFPEEEDKLFGRFIGIAFDQNDEYLYASTSWYIHSWQISSGNIFKPADNASYPRRTLSFDIFSPFVIHGNDRSDIRILDTNEALNYLYTIDEAHSIDNGVGNIWDIEFNKSGSYFLSVGSDNTVRKWVVDRNQKGKTVTTDQIDSWKPVTGGGIISLDICKTNDGDIFAIGTASNLVKVYSIDKINKDEPTHEWESDDIGKGISSIAFSPDCSILIVGTIDGKIRLLDMSDNSINTIEVFGKSGIDDINVSHNIESLSFSSDGKLLAVGHSRGVSIFGVFKDY